MKNFSRLLDDLVLLLESAQALLRLAALRADLGEMSLEEMDFFPGGAGVDAAEDSVAVPGTQWLIVSGLAFGAPNTLKRIDVTSGRVEVLYPAAGSNRLDALTYPALLQLTACEESSCPVSGAPVTLSVTPKSVHDLAPASAIVSLVIPKHGSSCNGDRSSFCNRSLFFRSRRDALIWQASSPRARLLSVADAYQVGRLIARSRYPS